MPRATVESYHSMFIAFMSWIHGVDYDLDLAFSPAILGALTLHDITRFFKFKAFLISDDRDVVEQLIGLQGVSPLLWTCTKKVFHTLCQTPFPHGIESTIEEILQNL